MSSHPIVHIEIPAANSSEAGKFYGDVFGWKIESDPTYNYVMFATEGGPGGGFVQPTAATANNPEYKTDSLLVYIGTDDIDATLASIEAHGGKTVMPKQEIPQVGWFAVFRDPSGNQVALYTSMPR